MPPQIPRAPLRALAGSMGAASSSTNTSTRLFTTSAPLHEVIIPPESPRFISLPDLPQNDETKKPPVKGHLPVPREIFTKRAHKNHKLSGNFVRDTAPMSLAEQRGEPPKSEQEAWRRLMAESRRKALGAGITNLWRRKKARETKAKARADAHLHRNLAASRAPERLDEVYTRGSITQATLDTSVIRDPDHEERQRESAARTAAIQQTKSEARKDAIQRLYVEAGKFILTEEELAAKVDQMFTENHFAAAGRARGYPYMAENAWDGYGKPKTVNQMFSEMRGLVGPDVIRQMNRGSNKTIRRQKVVAGELTGGALSAN